MPIRFPTEAANADILGEDPDPATGPPDHIPKADSTPRERSDRAPERQSSAGEARPGKDINAAGFVKDKDLGKP